MPEFLDLEIARQIPNFWPAVLLAVGFPAVSLVLNEAIAACDRRGLALARSLRAFRTLVTPALALFIFVTAILEMPLESTTSRVTETIFWVVLLYAILGLFNDLFFGLAGTDSWRERVPTLFRDLVRAILVAVGGLVIYSKVWGQEVEGALAALGVGSIVIGLALQEPLGNLVSGLMLLFERPLSVGDWVEAEGVKGKVTEINWRSVRIETPTREQLIVPNVSLYKAAFSNLSRPTTVRSDFIEVDARRARRPAAGGADRGLRRLLGHLPAAVLGRPTGGTRPDPGRNSDAAVVRGPAGRSDDPLSDRLRVRSGRISRQASADRRRTAPRTCPVHARGRRHAAAADRRIRQR
jgi:hypothetical protein